MNGSVLGFDNTHNIVLSNWLQPFVKPVSRPENVGGDGSWPDWDIKIAGELTPSLRLRIVVRFLMRCLLHYQELHPRVNCFCIILRQSILRLLRFLRQSILRRVQAVAADVRRLILFSPQEFRASLDRVAVDLA
jgi:hypothetical protein